MDFKSHSNVVALGFSWSATTPVDSHEVERTGHQNAHHWKCTMGEGRRGEGPIPMIRSIHSSIHACMHAATFWQSGLIRLLPQENILWWIFMALSALLEAQDVSIYKSYHVDITFKKINVWTLSYLCLECNCLSADSLSEKHKSKILCHCRDLYDFCTSCYTLSSQFFSTEQEERGRRQTGW